jgi:hypothetical protein
MAELKPNDKRAKVAIIVFYVFILVSAIFALFSLFTIYFYTNISNGTTYSDQTVALIGGGEVALALANFSANLVTIITFILWFRRAYANLDRVGTHITQSNDNMAFWGFAIPIMNLFKPYQMMKETWEKTQQTSRSMEEAYQMNQASVFILTWWLWFVVSRIVDQISLRLNLNVETIEDYISAAKLDTFVSLFDILGCFLTIYMIKKIASKEKDMSEMLELKRESESPENSPFTGDQTLIP